MNKETARKQELCFLQRSQDPGRRIYYSIFSGLVQYLIPFFFISAVYGLIYFYLVRYRVVRDDNPARDRYRQAIWVISSNVASRFGRFDDFAGVLIVTRWGHSPYEMGAFPLQDGEHFPLRVEQISISSADRNENLARAPAYPLGWASSQVLLSSGVGCLQIN